MRKTILIWAFAFVVTISAAVYQRLTGPTYPIGVSVTLNDQDYSFELPRSHGGEGDAEIVLNIADTAVSGQIQFRRYPTEDPWETVELQREGYRLTGRLPHQLPAGKLEYTLKLSDNRRAVNIATESPVVIRFKGDVPAWVMIPHIAFIMAAMFMSNLAGISAAVGDRKFRLYTFLAFGLLTLGGMILGPIVQLYAFDALWTGVPFGWDLTDNKTLIAFVFFLLAALGNIKKERPYLTVIAAVTMLVVFSIPHSMLGSQLDYSSGAVTTA